MSFEPGPESEGLSEALLMLKADPYQLASGVNSTGMVPLAAPTAEDIDLEVLGATWTAQGPSPATDGQVENVNPNDQVIGAIHTVVAHPTDANILWVGAVNGGVWRTKNATAASPTWTPLTDEFTSLSIGALALDPTDTDPENDGLRILAGNGKFSSFSGRGGALSGLLLSEDGGDSFLQISPPGIKGRNISGVALRGDTILMSANNFNGGINGGIYRSTDGGSSWTFISGSNGLDSGAGLYLAEDSTNNARLYVSVQGVGIFRSDDTGLNWTNISSGDTALNTAIGQPGNNNTEMTVSPVDGRLWVGVCRNGRPVYIGYSTDQGTTWTQMDLPVTLETDGGLEGLNPREKPGGQGAIHFSLIADPTNANIVYVGGDRQDGPFPNAIGAEDFTGRLFRGDASEAAVDPGSSTNAYSPQWQPLTHKKGGFAGGGTANSSAPHADSRDMTFRADGTLVEVDDGGIYIRTSPRTGSGDWFSIIGNLQVTEQHDIAWDPVSNILISGNQDTGTTQQVSTGSSTWLSVSTADGGDVAVSRNPSDATQSIRYSSFQNLGRFTRRVYDNNNILVSTTPVALTGFSNNDVQFVTPVAVNTIDPRRIIIGGSSNVWESLNLGDNVSTVSGGIGVNSFDADPIAYGGRRGGVDNADVLYVGSNSDVYLRDTSGGNLATTNYAGGFVRDLVLDPDDWHHIFALDGDQVWRSSDKGNSWIDITGDLAGYFDFGNDDVLRSIEFVSGPAIDAVIVGSTRGVFASLSNDWDDWFQLGPKTLPNAPVWEMDVDLSDNLLAAGTLGRGAWSLGSLVESLASSPSPDLGGPYTVDEGGSVKLNASASSDPNGLNLTFLWDLDQDGIFGETGSGAQQGDETGATPTFNANGLDGPSLWDVGLRVINSIGSSASTTGSIQVQNVAPSTPGLVINKTEIDENGMVNLDITFDDPGIPDSHTVTIDWKDGNTSQVSVPSTGSLGRSISISHQYLDDAPATGTPVDQFAILVAVADDDGGSSQKSIDLTVKNIAPIITSFASDATFENPGAENVAVKFTASLTDTGTLDTHRAYINWGDGTGEQEVSVTQGAGSGTVKGSHSYSQGGVYTVKLRLVDDDTGEDHEYSYSVVTGAGINNGVLQVVGTNTADNVLIHNFLQLTGASNTLANTSVKSRVRVQANLFGPQKYRDFKFSEISYVRIYLCSGNDYLTIGANLFLDTIANGGNGNDTMTAGGGAVVFMGDAGNDCLSSLTLRSILIGGEGRDKLYGMSNDDILIGGRTKYDDANPLLKNDFPLLAILAEWKSRTDDKQRVANISNGLGPLLGGSGYLLDGSTVFDDAAADLLSGIVGRDWFIDDGKLDMITGLRKGITSRTII